MSKSIEDISITSLSIFPTNGGSVLKGIRNDEQTFDGFGEAYFSKVNYGEIKAWKLHKKMTMNLIVPVGKVKFVFYDGIKNTFRAETIGTFNYVRITVPPGIWFGFKGLDNINPNIVFNLANIKHNAEEVSRKGIDEISYDWN